MNYRVCFAAYLRRRGRRDATVKSYVLALAEFCKYSGCQGRKRSLCKRLAPGQVEAYKLYLLSRRGLRPSTVNRRLSALSAFARFLMEKRRLSSNPLELVPRAGRKTPSTDEIRTSWEGVQRLRAEAHKDVLNIRDRAVVELLYAGLTVREMCGLKHEQGWSPDNNTIKAGERPVSLHAGAITALKHYMILRPILRGGYLLVGAGPGCSLKPGSVYGIIRRLARICGIKTGVRDVRLAGYAAEVYGFSPAGISAAVAA